jgi:hypothetical protein
MAIVEGEEMPAFGLVEAQCIGKGVEHLCGGPDVAALFQPCVPSGADAGEHGELLAPETRRAPTKTLRQAHLGRRQPLAARAQKGCEFTAAGFECVGSLVHGGDHISIDTRIKLELFAVSRPRMMPAPRVVETPAD